MGIHEDQKALLQSQMKQINDRLALAQTAVQGLQDEKQELKGKLDDLKAAYFAWKGQQL